MRDLCKCGRAYKLPGKPLCWSCFDSKLRELARPKANHKHAMHSHEDSGDHNSGVVQVKSTLRYSCPKD